MQFKFVMCNDKFLPLAVAAGAVVEPNFTLILESELSNPKNARFVPTEIKGFDNAFYFTEDLKDKSIVWIQEATFQEDPGRYKVVDEPSLKAWADKNLGQDFINLMALYQNDRTKFDELLVKAEVYQGKTTEEMDKLREKIKELSGVWKFSYPTKVGSKK